MRSLEELLGMPLARFARLDKALRMGTPVGKLILASNERVAQWLRKRGGHEPILTAYQLETLLQVTKGDQQALRVVLEALVALEGELVGVFLKGGRKDGVSPSPTKVKR